MESEGIEKGASVVGVFEVEQELTVYEAYDHVQYIVNVVVWK